MVKGKDLQKGKMSKRISCLKDDSLIDSSKEEMLN